MENSYWLKERSLPAHLKTVSSNFQPKYKIMIDGSFSAKSGASSWASVVQNASRSIIHVEAVSSNRLPAQIAKFEGSRLWLFDISFPHLQPTV